MSEGSSGAPGLVWRGLHLGALWALAVAQPHFEFLSSGEAFVLLGWQPLDIVVYTAAVVVTVPTLMVGAELVVRMRSERLAWWLHLLFVGAIVGVFCGYVIKRVDADAHAAVFLLAILAGLVGAAGYGRLPQLRSLVSFLSPAPLIVAGLFLFGSNVTPLAFPRHAETTSPARNPAPVVMIIFDELPTVSLMDGEGNLDESSYPNFARLARRATWFRNATTVADLTNVAVPAILTGVYDDSGDPATHRAYPNNLFSLLAPSHRLHAHETFSLCSPDQCPENEPAELPGRLTGPVPALLKTAASSFAPNAVIARLPEVRTFELPRLADFDGLAQDLSRDREAQLLFVHSMFPHLPWSHLPSGTLFSGFPCCGDEFFPDLGFVPQLGLPVPLEDRWREDRELIRSVQQLHLAQLRFTDRLLGELIDQLESRALFDDAMIVVTSDHGASFAAGESFRYLSEGNRAEILPVPLFVKRPGQRRGRVDDANVQTVDVLPTIAEELGIEVPWRMDGEPLYPQPPDREVITAIRVTSEDEFQFPAGEVISERDALARELDSAFGPGEQGIRPFRFGPDLGLIGRPARAVAREARVEAGVSLDDPDAYRAVDPATGVIPAWIRGTVVGGQAGEVDGVAIALNGDIAATAHVHDIEGTLRFYGLIPEPAFRQGMNEVEILASGRAWKGFARLPVVTAEPGR